MCERLEYAPSRWTDHCFIQNNPSFLKPLWLLNLGRWTDKTLILYIKIIHCKLNNSI